MELVIEVAIAKPPAGTSMLMDGSEVKIYPSVSWAVAEDNPVAEYTPRIERTIVAP